MPFDVRHPTVPSLLLALLLAGSGGADDRPGPRRQKRVHQVPRADAPIEVDGVLEEPAWARAVTISLDYETDPGENVPAPVATECLLTHDDDRLYVAFRAHDPEPARIRARLADRDAAFSDDYVGIVLDTFNDERRAYQLFVNPLGVQMDMTRDDVADVHDESWDAIWDSAGRLTGDGYAVEMAIPFSSLSFPARAGAQTWGIDAVRIYPRSSRRRFANNPDDRDVDCYLCQLEKLEGFEGVSPGRNLEINPTLTAGRVEERGDDGGFASGGEEVDPGLTVSWGVTPNMTLAATVNPDFSQVEADTAQLDVNERFALFFPERRPFFLEDADLFRTPLNTVFTRNVADPSWGVKATGKQGRHAVGVFVAEDELTNLLFPGSQGSSAGSFDFATTDAVVRYRRDVGASSTLGAIVTSRRGDEYSNAVGGVDALVRFGGGSDSLRLQVLTSRTEYPRAVADEHGQPAGGFDGHALHANYVHQDENWRWWGVYYDVGERFRADMGFMPRVGYELFRTGVQRTFWGEDGDWYNFVRTGVNYHRRDDAAGRPLEDEHSAWVNFEGPKQSFFEVTGGTRERHFNGVRFDETFYWSWSEIQPTGKLWLGLWYRGGDDVDFANTRPGEVTILEPNLRYDVGRRVRLTLSHQLRRLEVDGGTVFDAGLTQARVVYQLNLRSFVRAVVQYTDVERDLALFDDPESFEAKTERLFTQLLFSYKVNPRTVLFLGYSDNYRGDESVALTQENRALFLKIGYAWVL